MGEEIWKDINGYEGLYKVSNLGNIKRFNKSKNRKFNINRNGYVLVNLYKNGTSKNLSVHRLVAKSFIPNPENKPQVNHIDGNKLNNCISNLEWCTAKENIIHTYKKLNRKGVSGNKKKLAQNSNAKIVYQYDLKNNLIKRWGCIKEATIKLNISDGMISKCCHNERKTAGGYIWKFEERCEDAKN